jgi:hypothetical protein
MMDRAMHAICPNDYERFALRLAYTQDPELALVFADQPIHDLADILRVIGD